MDSHSRNLPHSKAQLNYLAPTASAECQSLVKRVITKCRNLSDENKNAHVVKDISLPKYSLHAQSRMQNVTERPNEIDLFRSTLPLEIPLTLSVLKKKESKGSTKGLVETLMGSTRLEASMGSVSLEEGDDAHRRERDRLDREDRGEYNGGGVSTGAEGDIGEIVRKREKKEEPDIGKDGTI